MNDFYFDDETWTIRYMVVDTGKWLSGRKVLISLASVGEPDWKSLKLPVTLTRDQVRHSPDIDTKKPVYRQHETKLHRHYQLPLYWQGNYGGGYPGNLGTTFGIVPSPVFFGGEDTDNMESCPPEQNNDPHLRSIRHITGHDVCGTDGKIGNLEDFMSHSDFMLHLELQSMLPGLSTTGTNQKSASGG